VDETVSIESFDFTVIAADKRKITLLQVSKTI